MTGEHFDVLVVGAGISGICAGYHLQASCPGRTYAILESLTADVWVSQHAGVFDMQGKLPRREQKPNPYIDPKGFRRWVATSRERFAALLAQQLQAR